MGKFWIALVGVLPLLGCTSNITDDPLNAITNPTFSEHIAPIITQKCLQCHAEGGTAPFSLTTFDKVKRKAKTIARVTQLRFMPPWPADPQYSHFLDEKVLSQAQIDLIDRWVKQGCAPGSGALTLQLPGNHPSKSDLGIPDLQLKLAPVAFNAGDQDRFFLSRFDVDLIQLGWREIPQYIRAIEIVPGQPKLLHHFNGHLIRYNPSQKLKFSIGQKMVEFTNHTPDQMEKEQIYKKSLLNDDGSIPDRVHSVVNYLPGVRGLMYPEGIGTIPITSKFSILGNDVHYGPSTKAVIDSTILNVFFTKIPPKRGLGELMLGTNGVSKIVPPLVIPPNKMSTHLTEFTVSEDISVLTVNPHLHLLGKSFLAYALKPNGDTVRLIRIPRWDFRWQYFYTFPKMVHIPKGSIIRAIAEFDNTDQNPNNPNHPPKTVSERLEYGGSSMRASDEMFQFIITYLGYQPGDEQLSLKP